MNEPCRNGGGLDSPGCGRLTFSSTAKPSLALKNCGRFNEVLAEFKPADAAFGRICTDHVLPPSWVAYMYGSTSGIPVPLKLPPTNQPFIRSRNTRAP